MGKENLRSVYSIKSMFEDDQDLELLREWL